LQCVDDSCDFRVGHVAPTAFAITVSKIATNPMQKKVTHKITTTKT